MRKRSIRRRLREQDWRQLPAALGYHADRLCERWGVTRLTLWRAFREEFRTPPQRLLDQFRDLKARELIRHGVRKKEIVQLLGYKHASHLSRRLKQSAYDALTLLEMSSSRLVEVIHNSETQG